MSSPPIHCRPAAYALMREALQGVERSEALLLGAIAIAAHPLPDADPARAAAEIEGLAGDARGRLRGDHPEAVLAHAHAVLFDERGFTGDIEDYYNPRNSWLPVVLARRRGLPITLTLVYKLVLEELGLEVVGINAPGHFLARVRLGSSAMLVDPFFGGRVLTEAEAVSRAQRTAGASARDTAALLPAASHRDWLVRMVNNLIAAHTARRQGADAAAMGELRDLLLSA